MRKLLALLLTTLFVSGTAFAQDDAATTIDVNPEADFYGTTQWVGVGLGYPVHFYYGINDLLSDTLDVRLHASSYIFDLRIGADAIFDITRIEDVPIIIYGGGGPHVSVVFTGGFGLGAGGVVGGEYRISEQLGAFVELGASFTVYLGSRATGFNVFPVLPRGALGVNFHF